MPPTKTSAERTADFSDKHPEVGPVSAGETMTSHQLRKLGALLNKRVADINYKSLMKDSSEPDERSFVRQSADMLLRTLQVSIVDSPGVQFETTDLGTALQRIVNATSASDRVLRTGYAQRFDDIDVREASSHGLERVTDAATGIVQRVENDKEAYDIHCTNLGEVIDASMQGIVAIAELRGGLPVTQYLQGNLHSMLGQYERTDRSV